MRVLYVPVDEEPVVREVDDSDPDWKQKLIDGAVDEVELPPAADWPRSLVVVYDGEAHLKEFPGNFAIEPKTGVEIVYGPAFVMSFTGEDDSLSDQALEQARALVQQGRFNLRRIGN